MSFCGHVVAEGAALYVQDASLDSRFATNPLVVGEPHIRFYAGEPLTTLDGMHLGALCVIDRVPRQLSVTQKRALRSLCKAATSHLELHRSLSVRTELQTTLTRTHDDLTMFTRAASHDLRGPLRNIMWMVDALERPAGPTEAQRQTMLVAIRGSAKRAHRLVDDLLRHATIQSTARHAPVELEQVVQDVRDDLVHLIAERSATIHTNGLPQLHTNREAWYVILSNLIENAIRYTPEEQTVDVHVQVEVVEQRILLQVHDAGSGIQAKYVERIFQPLERLHPSEVAGSGIGLSTVKKVVGMLGGDVTVSPRDPVGSTFTVTVPYPDGRKPAA
jgi:signal transduction histidine kinase